MDSNAKTQAVERIKEAQNVLITVSSNPSVDQLAAAIGLTIFLNKLDKHATAVFSVAIPSTLEFLEPEETLEPNTDSLRDFIISLDKSKADKLRYKVEDDVVRIYITPYRTSLGQEDMQFTQGDFNVDVVVALGVQEQDQLDQAIRAHGRIFHDATIVGMWAGEGGTEIGSINWMDPKASSLCEMLMAISESLQSGNLDEQIATAYLTGIVANTDRFKNERTTPKVMSMSAQLMAAGANQQLIAKELSNPPLEIPDYGVDFNEQQNQEQPEPQDYEVEDGVLSLRHDDDQPRAPKKQNNNKKLHKLRRRGKSQDDQYDDNDQDYQDPRDSNQDNIQQGYQRQNIDNQDSRQQHYPDNQNYQEETRDIWQDGNQPYEKPIYRDEKPRFEEPPAYRHKVITPPERQGKQHQLTEEYQYNDQAVPAPPLPRRDYIDTQPEKEQQIVENKQFADEPDTNEQEQPVDSDDNSYLRMGGPQMVIKPTVKPPEPQADQGEEQELTLPEPTSPDELPQIRRDRGSRDYIDEPPIAAEGGKDWGVQDDEPERPSIDQGADQNYSKFMTEPPIVSGALNSVDTPNMEQEQVDPLASIESSGPISPQDMPSTVPPQLATDDDAESPLPPQIPTTPHEMLQDDGVTDVNKDIPLGPEVNSTDTLSDIEQEVQEYEQAVTTNQFADPLEQARQQVQAIQDSATSAPPSNQPSAFDSVAPPVDFMPLGSEPYGPPPPQAPAEQIPQFDPQMFSANEFDQDLPPEYPPPFTPFTNEQPQTAPPQAN